MYANDLLKKFGMYDCKSVVTPVEPTTKISSKNEPKTEEEMRKMEDKPYRGFVGG